MSCPDPDLALLLRRARPLPEPRMRLIRPLLWGMLWGAWVVLAAVGLWATCWPLEVLP